MCECIDGYEGLYGVDLPRIERLEPLERGSASVVECWISATDLPYDVRQSDPRFVALDVCVPVHGDCSCSRLC